MVSDIFPLGIVVPYIFRMGLMRSSVTTRDGSSPEEGQCFKSPANGTQPENHYLTLIYDKNTFSIHCKLGSC